MHRLALSKYQRNGLKILLAVILAALIFSVAMLYNNLNANLDDADLNVLSIMNANAQRLFSVINHHKGGFYGQASVLWSMPFFADATSDEIQSQRRDALEEGERYYFGGANPFREDSQMYSFIAQARSLVLSNSELDMLLFYSPVSRCFAGIAGNGADVIVSPMQDMDHFPLLTCEQWGELLRRRSLVFAPERAEQSDSNRMLWSTIMENGVFCIYGITADTLDSTIFTVNYGPVYVPHIFLLYDNDGEVLMKADEGYEELAGRDWSAMPSISYCRVGGKKLTVMNLAMQEFSGMRFVAAFEKASTLALNGNSIHYFFMQCTVWLISSLVCALMLVRYYSRPIQNILTVLPQDMPSAGAADELTHIAASIQTMAVKLNDTTKIVQQQSRQLRREYLRKALFSGKLSEAEIVEITQAEPEGFFDRYGIAVFYSLTENFLTEAAAEAILPPGMFPCPAALLTSRGQLLLIVSDPRMTAEDFYSLALKCNERLQRQTGAAFQVYTSELCSGVAAMNEAYLRSLLNGDLKSVRALGEAAAPTPRRSGLGSAESRVVDALTACDYGAAYAAFQEYVDAVFRLYVSPAERAILLSGLMGTAYYHLIAAHPEKKEEVSEALLQSLIVSSASRDEILAFWEQIFCALGEEHSRRTSQLFQQINAYMEEHYTDNSLSLTTLADALNVSTASLSREFKRNTGSGYLEHLHKIRIAAAKKYLQESGATIREIAEMVGYDSVLTMTRAFKKYENTTPGSYRGSDAAKEA